MVQETSGRQTASENDYVVTPDEAKRMGLEMKTAPPEAKKCRFCGKILQPRGLRYKNRVLMWIPTPTRCDCPKAVAYWKKYDAKQAEDKRRAEDEEQKVNLQMKIDRLLINSGIKKRFLQRTFDNFTIDTKGRKACYKTAKEYADNWQAHKLNGDGLYIEGTNGTGKTHLAVAIALKLINDGVPVICKTSGDLLLDIKRTFETSGITEAEVLGVYKQVDLLVIDDLGKEQCSDWSISTLYSIFNDRYEAMKPTIITTNYNADDLIRALTPKGGDGAKAAAIISRLKEVSTVMTMAWEDIRGKKI